MPNDEPLRINSRVYVKSADVFGVIKGVKTVPPNTPPQYIILGEDPMPGFEFVGTVESLRIQLIHNPLIPPAFSEAEFKATLVEIVPEKHVDAVQLWPMLTNYDPTWWESRSVLENTLWLLLLAKSAMTSSVRTP